MLILQFITEASAARPFAFQLGCFERLHGWKDKVKSAKWAFLFIHGWAIIVRFAPQYLNAVLCLCGAHALGSISLPSSLQDLVK